MESSEAQTSAFPQLPQKSPHFHSSSPSHRLDNESNNSHPSWSTETPMKLPSNPPRPKRSPHSAKDKIPEQYDMLLRLFNGLDSALRLLQMRKSVPFFMRIRATVECITGSLWLSVLLMVITGAGIVYYYDQEKKRHIEGIEHAIEKSQGRARRSNMLE